MLKFMNSTELMIENIKSLRMIHFYYIYKDDEKIPALVAYYDRNKVLNLCELDEYYEKFLDKVWDVYKAQKDSTEIVMDDYSRKILESAITKKDGLCEAITKDMQVLPVPYSYHKGYMKIVTIPVIKYVIEQLYGMQQQTFRWNLLDKDWFGVGELSAITDNGKIVFPYNVSCIKEGWYSITVSNVLMHSNAMTIDVMYKNYGIEICINSKPYQISGEIKYLYRDNELVCTADISINGKQAYVNKESVASSSDFEVTDKERLQIIFGGNKEQQTCYKLPWGEAVLVDAQVIENENLKETYVTLAYVSQNDLEEYIHAYSFKNIEPKTQVSYTVYDYALEIYYSLNNDDLCQMHFLDMGYGSSGYYKSEYVDKYYTKSMRG